MPASKNSPAEGRAGGRRGGSEASGGRGGSEASGGRAGQRRAGVKVSADRGGRRRGGAEASAGRARILRSVLMKPESENYTAQLHARIEELAG